MMKNTCMFLCLLCLASCGTSIKLAIPDQFREQANMMEVKGARGNHMSFGNYSTSRISRGIHMSYPGWARGFFLENLLLNQAGIKKSEDVIKEKAKFRYSISDGNSTVNVFGKENQLMRSLNYKFRDLPSPISSYDRLQQYQYIFSVKIVTDTLAGGRSWDMIMTNSYDRKQDTVNSLFTIIPPGDNGFATDGKDTILIRALTIQKTESPGGKTAWLPFKLVSGYELSTSDGVAAIVDAINRNIWFYKDLDAQTQLTMAAISTAIFARKVKDVKW